jgi:hypothetical protein
VTSVSGVSSGARFPGRSAAAAEVGARRTAWHGHGHGDRTPGPGRLPDPTAGHGSSYHGTSPGPKTVELLARGPAAAAAPRPHSGWPPGEAKENFVSRGGIVFKNGMIA